MIKQLKYALALVLGLTATSALADPPPASHHHWINSNYASHYILYDNASRQWIETVNCQPAWRFNLVRREMNAIELHDPSRNMTVRLEYGAMYLKAAGATSFSLYQYGTFDRRERFSHYDSNGAWTGTITKQHGCKLVEYLAGSSSPNFRFVLANNNGGAVEMYDSSRDMWVKLDDSRMYLRTGNQPYGFFKNGRW